ncbi:MAG: serine kinase [Candidatus Edwardsbacteria bacterium]
MKLQEVAKNLNLEPKTSKESLDREVTGGYVSDLLSDVMAHSQKGNLWITLQIHENIVAVAVLKELAGVVIINGREPEQETLKKAEKEKVCILVSKMSAFELAGRLYKEIVC